LENNQSTVTKPVLRLKDAFIKCPICGGTTNYEPHYGILYCEGACGTEWNTQGIPIPQEKWLKLVTV